MSYTILVPLDGSMLAERALEPAIELAQQRMGNLKLVQVVPPDVETGPSLEYLQQRAERVSSAGVEVECQVRTGFPVATLLEMSARVDLIVLSSHGRSGFDRFFLGSVTEKVVRRSACPTLVVRANHTRLSETDRILVPLDGSRLSLEALPEAVRLAKATSATLVLCRVEEAAGVFLSLIPEELDEQRLQSYLKEIAADLDPAVNVETLHAFGPAARTLVDLISRQRIDLVVMTTHGRGGLDRLVCGSVAEGVMRVSHTPVLLVRAVRA